MLGRVAPALSVLVPLTTPLRGEAASYYAARLNVAFDFDAGRSKPTPR
jgi:cation transporter-like permease